MNPFLRQHLFPLLEEELASVLPEGVRAFWAETGDLPLLFQGEEIGALKFEGLEPWELKRWQRALQTLAEKLLQQLMEEKTCDGAPGRELLLRTVAQAPQQGLLLKAYSPPQGDFYCLGERLYFVTQAGRELLFSFWREQEPVVALNLRLKKPEDLDDALGLLKLADLLGFSWLSSQGARYLEDLGLLEIKPEELEHLAQHNAQGCVLLWGKGPKPSLNCLENRAAQAISLPEDQALLALDLPLAEVLSLIRDLSLRSGILPPGPSQRPLAQLWASYEHACRLPQEQGVVFEPYSLHALGDVYLELGDLDAARRSYFWALLGSPQLVDLLNSLAVVMIQLGDRQAARFFLSEAVRHAPSDPLLRYNLALFLQEEGLLEESAHHLQEAMHLAPEEPLYAEAWAKRLAQTKQWSRIIPVLQGKELSAEGYYLLGKALYETGALEEALQYFKKAQEKDPQHLLALAHLALLFVHLRGEYSLAEAVLPQLEGQEGELEALAQDLKTLLEGRL